MKRDKRFADGLDAEFEGKKKVKNQTGNTVLV